MELLIGGFFLGVFCVGYAVGVYTQKKRTSRIIGGIAASIHTNRLVGRIDQRTERRLPK